TQQVWRQYTRYIDRGWAVSTTDNTNRSGFQDGKIQDAEPVQQSCTQDGTEDTELCRCTQQQSLGVGKQRTEIGHGTHTHEDQQSPDGPADNDRVEVIQHTVAVTEVLGNRVSHGHLGVAGFFDSNLEGFFQLR